MSYKAEYAAIADLGRKIGIPNLAMQDFDLVFADRHRVDEFCDFFETLELTPPERLHLMQLTVASLELALSADPEATQPLERRVERLLSADLPEYKVVIDYWGRSELATAPLMTRLKKDPRYLYMGGAAPFEECPAG
jgi:hypothetical protein